ncbi:MAG: DNA polymerase III subunit chi [Alphaproteobacteria bacterium]
MVEINFYHLTRSALEQVLPDLLEKTLARGWKAVVIAGSPERAEALTQHLWTYRPGSFLPHGNAKDGDGEVQPIWLTHSDERPNAAEVLFLVDGGTSAALGNFQRVCEIFPGDDAEAVALARTRWQSYQAEGHTLSYWQQGANGWEKRQ